MTWLTNNNLCDNDGTRKELVKERAGDILTIPAPFTRDMSPLALAMLVRRGDDHSEKSLASYVM